MLIGGKAGFGIDKAGQIIAAIFNRRGYRIYVYRDYPSIIRGGHTFSLIRASATRRDAHEGHVDYLLALDQETFDLHKGRLKSEAVVIYDNDAVKVSELPDGIRTIGSPLAKVVKEEAAPDISRNTCIIAILCKTIGIDWGLAEEALRRYISKDIEANIKAGSRAYRESPSLTEFGAIDQRPHPLVSGNEAISLGLLKGGLKAYLAYPMTPSSPILHYLAHVAEEFSLKVIHPENEIAVMLMALGFSFAGERVAVGTSGGGFCLMTEGLSFSGMAELPIVVILGQRPGPSTGLPTYSCQTELNFALSAGQGEFTRFVVAPGDPEEAYYWSSEALNIAWKYQIPSIILSDKDLAEATYSFDEAALATAQERPPFLWDRSQAYKRYADTETGISPLAFPSEKDAIIKINSYEHDESGITTENGAITKKMEDKRLRKERLLREDLTSLQTVRVHGDKDAKTALLCWGSAKGVCVEAAQELGLKVVQVVVFAPFPFEEVAQALAGAKKVIAVEYNATAQCARLVRARGIAIHEEVLKYDGRPFSSDELTKKIEGLL